MTGPTAGALGRVLVDDGGHRGHRPAAPLERAVPLDRGIDRRAERPQVGGWRRVLAADPLRRGEPGRAHHHAGLGQLGVVGEGGDAEVGQHGLVAGADQHVARLDVAVHHPGRVRHAQRGKQLAGHLRRPPRRQRSRGGQHLVQRLRVDELHDDPRAAAVLGHVVDGDYGRVVEPGRGLGLTQHPLERGGPLLSGEGVGDLYFLEGHVTVEKLIAGTPDHAHGATAQRRLQTVTPGDHSPGVPGWVHSRTIHSVGPARLRAPAVGSFPPRSSQAPRSSVQSPTRPSARRGFHSSPRVIARTSRAASSCSIVILPWSTYPRAMTTERIGSPLSSASCAT